MPKRIQLSRRKGWRLPPDTVIVARRPGSQWGNPYKVANHGHAAICVKLYELWLGDPEQAPLRAAMKRDLRGKDLACWCRIGDPCHADVILKIANE